ncbi:hypothetical protein ASPWEDRAFT_44334 [Aspergillus wentii DTO 134E9]|uniref:MYND-type zinc finger protein samB n=1 Tax=Aspergillus wentii DTO 134E9 TaxID=1073089 RepID=A0A1L9RBD9_ASPWE|nr:uncharacterized protein ASPWEDRAFT_44334 [Aspergillus wentii DTO 134E9]OJJ32246.1 hypothetical protein ASPWEDRAFT_44334 [Aspergillus wentii DTO 134E9]
MGGSLYVCCQCNDGPKLWDSQPRCVVCGHNACGGYRHSHYSYTFTLPRCDKDGLESCRQDWLDKKARLGAEHDETLTSAFVIGKVLCQGRRYKAALGWYRYVFLAEIATHGPHAMRTSETRGAISELLTGLGRHEDAKRWEVPADIANLGCKPVE